MPGFVHPPPLCRAPEIAEYIARVTATFEPYGGRFLVHGDAHEVK
ncbi:DUF1330 domain-containing protein, partial [Streptomyces sp. NPDC003233]